MAIVVSHVTDDVREETGPDGNPQLKARFRYNLEHGGHRFKNHIMDVGADVDLERVSLIPEVETEVVADEQETLREVYFGEDETDEDYDLIESILKYGSRRSFVRKTLRPLMTDTEVFVRARRRMRKMRKFMAQVNNASESYLNVTPAQKAKLQAIRAAMYQAPATPESLMERLNNLINVMDGEL